MSAPKVTVEVHFAQRLASNEKTIRDKTIKKLRLWMTVRSKSGKNVFTEEDFLKLWKGLFYCMWMCDKALVQEELANNIAKLVHKLHTTESALMYFKTFLQTMEREWHGIDRLRMDKYYMFIRRVFSEQLEFLKEHQWNGECVGGFLDVLKQGPLNATNPTKAIGLLHHISDIYLEELTRVGAIQLSPQETLNFLDPFCTLVANTRNKSLMKTLMREIFEDIMVHSTVGMEEVIEEEKRMAKKKKSENDEEEGEDDSEDEDPSLTFDYSAIADRLFMLGSRKETPGLNRKKMYAMAQKFQDLAKGIYPIPDLEELAQLSSEDEIEDDVKLKHKRKQKERMRKAKLRMEKEEENGDSEVKDAEVNTKKRVKKGKKESAVGKHESGERIVNGDLHIKKKKKEKKNAELEDDISTEIDASISSKLLKKSKKNTKVDVIIDDSKVEIIDMGKKSMKVKKNKRSEVQEENKETMAVEMQVNTELSQNGKMNKKKTKKAPKRKSESSIQQMEEPFAKFQSVCTPPAVVLKKRQTPATERQRKKTSKLTAPGSAPAGIKKHVKITLSKNTNHKSSDYQKQIKCSPGIPYDSTKKPTHSVLKSTPTITPTNRLKLKKRRSNAADFF